MTTELAQQPKQSSPRTRTLKKVKVQEAPVPEPTPVQVEIPTVTEESSSVDSVDHDHDQELSLDDQLASIRETLANTVKDVTEKLKTLKSLDAELKKFSLSYKKELKSKSKKPKKVKSDVVSNHGFNAEVPISDELASFLGLSKGSKFRRPAAAKMISEYALKNNLKDATNKSIYIADAKLKKLLGPATLPIKKAKEGEEPYPLGYSIFNIQTYLKQHFKKST